MSVDYYVINHEIKQYYDMDAKGTWDTLNDYKDSIFDQELFWLWWSTIAFRPGYFDKEEYKEYPEYVEKVRQDLLFLYGETPLDQIEVLNEFEYNSKILGLPEDDSISAEAYTYRHNKIFVQKDRRWYIDYVGYMLIGDRFEHIWETPKCTRWMN